MEVSGGKAGKQANSDLNASCLYDLSWQKHTTGIHSLLYSLVGHNPATLDSYRATLLEIRFCTRSIQVVIGIVTYISNHVFSIFTQPLTSLSTVNHLHQTAIILNCFTVNWRGGIADCVDVQSWVCFIQQITPSTKPLSVTMVNVCIYLYCVVISQSCYMSLCCCIVEVLVHSRRFCDGMFLYFLSSLSSPVPTQ